MRYAAAITASAALGLVSAQAAVTDARQVCESCREVEQLETLCNDPVLHVHASCMCSNGFFTTWDACRDCEAKEKLRSTSSRARAAQAITSVSDILCAPTPTASFQSLFVSVSNNLGLYEAEGPVATAAEKPAVAAVEQSVATATADADAIDPAAFAALTSSSVSGFSTSATTASRTSAGVTSSTGSLSSARGLNSSANAADIRSGAAKTGAVVSSLAAVLVGAAAMLG